MKNWKRYVSFFLSLVMIIGMVPAMPVYADEIEVEEEIEVTEEIDVVEEAAEDGESGHVCAKYLEEHLERAATCGEEGRVAYWECDYCGAIYSDEGITILLPEAMGIPATGVHNWGEWFEAEEPAIGVPGLMLRFCVDCDAREEQEIPALEDPEKPEETPVPTEVPVSTPEGTEEPAPDDEDEGEDEAIDSGKAVASGKCGDNASWTLSDTGVLTISGTGAMWDYDYDTSAPWNDQGTEVSEIVIKDGITHIGSYSFAENYAYKITLSASVTSIGGWAFLSYFYAEGPEYRELHITDLKKYCEIDFGYDNFILDGNTKLYVGNNVVTALTIPAGTTKIGINAFQGNKTIKSVSIPSSVKSIEAGAFWFCTGLTSVSIANGVETIGRAAFDCTKNLETIYVPASVTSIGELAFGNTMGPDTKFKEINVDSGNACYSSSEGVLFNKDKTELIKCPEAKTAKNYTVPSTVTLIDGNAFLACTNLESITLPKGLRGIGSSAFAACTNLKSITIPGTVSNIRGRAFSNCVNLKDLILEKGVARIEEAAFSGCSSLDILAIPETVTSIGVEAFSYCTSLESVTLPSGVTEIGASAFYECGNLEDVFFLGTESQWNKLKENIEEGNDPLLKAKINFGYENCKEYKGDVTYYSQTLKENDTIYIEYYDSFFSGNSDTYNHALAKASLKFAMSAFPIEGDPYNGGENGRAKNAYDFLQRIGCPLKSIDDYRYDEKPITDSVGAVIGSKKLEDGSTLIAVAVRGQGYESEWGGNFRVAPTGKYHKGFELAADQVLVYINKYISEREELSGDIKLWITGYSRAAATANIVAGKLNNGEATLPGKVKYGFGSIFAYTFETPAGVNYYHAMCGNHYNIFNIINSTDFVPKLAPDGWDYARFGNDCFFPDLSDSKVKKELNVGEKYYEITGKSFVAPFTATKDSNYMRQSTFLDYAFLKISESVGVGKYYNKMQSGIIENCMENEGMPSKSVIFDSPALAPVVAANAKVVKEIWDNRSALEFSHYPEYCLAFMESLAGVVSGTVCYKYYIVKCPVDVSVTDSSGNVIAEIKDDTVTMQNGAEVDVFVAENGDKYVYVYDDGQYNLDLEATDDGVMDCTVVDYQRGQGKSSQSVFFDVPLTEGESYTAPFSMTDNSYVLIEESGSSISPDVILSRDELYNTTVAITVVGNGTAYGASDNYSIGDTADLVAVAAENHVFLGWYENGELLSRDENYSFSVKGDTALEAKFISTDVTLTLNREYLAVEQEPGRTEPLSLSIEPAEWEEFLTWSVDADENNQDVISVDEQGTVTVHGPGMAYALATVSFKDYEFTARCRVDISSEPIGEQLEENFGLNGIQLGTDKATVELYSTNYTELEILPLLQQNIEAMSVGGEKPKDNGVAVSSARFSDPEAAKVFDLIVKDDRTLLIVPKDTNADVAGSYSSAVAATIDGIEFETSAAVSIAVKKSLPKLTASAVTINPFFSDASAELSVSGGEISNIRLDSAKDNPDYVTIEGSTIKLLSGAPDTGSATLNLLADVEGWAMPAVFTAKLTLKYTAPQLKLSATAVTMQDNFEYSRGVELKLMPKNAKQTLSELGVEDLIAPEGYSVDFNDIDGSFVLKATEAPKTETITLKVKIAGTDEEIELNLKVTVTAVALKLKKSNISLASSAPYSSGVGLSVNPADYELQQLNVRITDKAGTLDLTDTKPLNVEYRNGTVYVSATDTTIPGYTYKVWLSAYKGGKETALTVSVLSPEKSAITSTVKASGTIDLSIKGSSITVTPSYKNYELTGDEFFGYKVKAMNGKTALGDQSELFDILKSGNSFVISAKDAENINPKYNYSFVLTTVAANGLQTTAKEVKLSVKESAIKLKLSPSSVNINTTVDDTAVVEVSSALKGYVLTEPIVEVMDKSGKLSAQGQLDAEYSGGKLYIKINENTVAAAYKLLIKAEEGHPAASLTVNILSGTKAAIKVSQSVKGSIDVIRPATEISVSAPKFKGYSGTYTQSFKVIGFRGTKELGDYSEQFVITENDDGSAVIRATSAVDHSLKYKLRRELYLPKGDSTVPVPVADAPLQVKMGSAKFTANVKAAQLYALDKNSVGVVTLIPGDWALSGIDRVRIKPAKGSEAFTLKDFGGNQYAIGFADGYARITKGGSVTLEIFLEGNHSAKPNATVSVKLNIK